MKQQADLRVVRGQIDGISWVFAVGPAGEPCPSCPKTNERSPLRPECSAKREESAPVAKAPGGNRKLTWPQVEAIRLLLRGGQSQRRVARLFNVSRGAISRIARGSTWKDKDRDEVMGAGPSGELRVSNDRQKGKEKGLKAGPSGGFGQYQVSSGELRVERQSKSNKGGGELNTKAEEDGGIWLVTEPVQLPGMLLDIPCGMFRSKEQAQAYLREWRERLRQLRVTSGELRVEIKSKSQD